MTIEVESTPWSLLSSYAFFIDSPFFIRFFFFTQTEVKQFLINKNLNCINAEEAAMSD